VSPPQYSSSAFTPYVAGLLNKEEKVPPIPQRSSFEGERKGERPRPLGFCLLHAEDRRNLEDYRARLGAEK